MDQKQYIRERLFDLLQRHLDIETLQYLDKSDNVIERLLVDFLALEKEIANDFFVGERLHDNVTGRYRGQPEASASDIYYDFSFVVSPAYRAYEGFLFLLAESLGLKRKQEIIQNIGRIYNDDEIYQLKKEIITETGKKLDNKDKDLLGIVSELKRVLELYRHNPAHYYGDRIDTLEKASNYGRTVLNVINLTTKTLIQKGYLRI